MKPERGLDWRARLKCVMMMLAKPSLMVFTCGFGSRVSGFESRIPGLHDCPYALSQRKRERGRGEGEGEGERESQR